MYKRQVVTTSDLSVVLRVTSTGVESTLTETTDYALSATNNDYSNGGTVTTVATYASGYTLTLIRETALTQSTTLQDSGILRVAALESALDKLTLLVQQMQEQLDRALIIPKSETIDMALANSVDRANQYLVFSATGAPTVSSSGFTSDDYTVSSYMEGILDDTSEGVFKATVNLEIGTDVQAYDAELAGLASVTSAANKLPYFTGSGTASVATFPAFARTYLDDAAGDDVFATLGLLDEDDMATDDPCVPASQQSVKAAITAHGVVQVVNVMDGAVDTGTTQMVADDSIPQIAEGDEYMTLAITPTSATNNLKIEVVVNVSNDYAGAYAIVSALFQDTTANALAASHFTSPATLYYGQVIFTHYMAAGTTSETTFRVRAGANAAGTTTFNGINEGRYYGGVAASSITITEYEG